MWPPGKVWGEKGPDVTRRQGTRPRALVRGPASPRSAGGGGGLEPGKEAEVLEGGVHDDLPPFVAGGIGQGVVGGGGLLGQFQEPGARLRTSAGRRPRFRPPPVKLCPVMDQSVTPPDGSTVTTGSP